jgi:hypothetical protein
MTFKVLAATVFIDPRINKSLQFLISRLTALPTVACTKRIASITLKYSRMHKNISVHKMSYAISGHEYKISCCCN